jgi:hypothetical protein
MANYVVEKFRVRSAGAEKWDVCWAIIDKDEVHDEQANRGVIVHGIPTRTEAEELLSQRQLAEAVR